MDEIIYQEPSSQLKVMSETVRPMNPTKRQRLERLKQQLEQHLAKVNEAIKSLNDNPNVEDVINKIDAAL